MDVLGIKKEYLDYIDLEQVVHDAWNDAHEDVENALGVPTGCLAGCKPDLDSILEGLEEAGFCFEPGAEYLIDEAIEDHYDPAFNEHVEREIELTEVIGCATARDIVLDLDPYLTEFADYILSAGAPIDIESHATKLLQEELRRRLLI